MTEYDPNARAFASSEAKELVTAEVSPTESESTETATSGAEPVVEQEVPYSRFATANRRAREAEAAAESARQAYEELRASRTEVRETPRYGDLESEIQSRVIKLYGDNDTAKEIANIQIESMRQAAEIARKEARETVETREVSETKRIEANEQTIDERLEDLSSYLGRNITQKEEDSLLGIVDEYTPKDENGNYLGDTISFDKAWNILQMQQAQSGIRSSQSRATATALTSTRSSGEPSHSQDENFDPRDWNAFKKRLN